MVETGYRIITAPDTAVENRLIEAVTFHYPLLDQVLITDRNRFDLDWQNGEFPWRYRNKLTGKGFRDQVHLERSGLTG